MAESTGTNIPNGVYVQVETENDKYSRREETLYGVLHALISMILYPDPSDTLAGASLQQRIKVAVSEKAPLLRDASKNSVHDVLLWTRKGTPLRSLLVISVGTMCCISLTGLLVFVLFFVTATVNAIVIALLVSLAAVGGFLALLFTGLAIIYIGALSAAVFVIATVTIIATLAVLVTSGWVGIFYVIWLSTKKGIGLAKTSLNISTSTFSACSGARSHHESNEHSD